MKEENWIRNTNKVQLWLEEEDRGAQGEAITISISLGNNCGDDTMRSTYWTAIRSIGSSFDDFPLARIGRESSLPLEVQTAVDSVKAKVKSVFAGIGEDDLILTVILPHGRTGGAFDDMDALSSHFADKAGTAMVKAYKDGRWDGSMNGNVPAMTPPAVKADEGGQEEE
jgi:hypothetical protein